MSRRPCLEDVRKVRHCSHFMNSGSAADRRKSCVGITSTPNRYRVVLFLSILAYHGIDKYLKRRFINPLLFRKRVARADRLSIDRDRQQ